MSRSLRAWLLEWPAQPLALAQCEVIEVVDAPEVHRLPVGPAWCRSLLYWRGRFLPLALAADVALDGLSIVVVAYQTGLRTSLEYAAIAVCGIPRQIDVPTDADCEPPGGCVLADSQLRACFMFEGRTITVPELRALFAPAPTLARAPEDIGVAATRVA